ncbi:hypothetical protein [Vibrio alginolyticus]|uniref:hypothetical protein n=1 Tax=Vibrio alginolyticus TaxID=663 RepID=UPI001BD53858|nr:hypothetical protein [Vibrio alginolyticus]MBS9935779.1 hypothetical protein [Vibrio alginolyticus]
MHQYSLKIYRGDTFQSDYFTLFDDAIPEFITQEEIDQGIVDGIYNKLNLNDLSIIGQARSGYDGLKIFDLVIVKDTEQFHFEIPPAATTSMTGGHQTLVYDIQVKDLNDVVTTIVSGTITVMPDVTTENAF